MTIDDVVRLFEGDDRVAARPMLEESLVCLTIRGDGDVLSLRVWVERRMAWAVTIMAMNDVRLTPFHVPHPAALAARLLIAAEVVETLRTSGVVDGQRVGGA